MATAAVLTGTSLVTSATWPTSLFIGGLDIIRPLGTTNIGVPIESIRIVESGGAVAATLDCVMEDPAKAFALPARAPVALWDNVRNECLFGGYVAGRKAMPDFGDQGRSVRLTAIDGSIVLERRRVVRVVFPAGMSDQAMVQSLVGGFGGPLQSLSGTVKSTNASMPAVTIESVSLRGAIEQVGAAALADGGGLPRRVFVDPLLNVHYYTTAPFTAPYTITDTPTVGTQRAVEDLDYDSDDSQIVNAVYVQGGNANGSGWVYAWDSIAAYGLLEDTLDVAESDTATKRDAYGAAFLAETKDPLVRGSFRIVGSDGWHGGQTLTITNAALGLSGVTQPISQVETAFLGGNVRSYKVSFGARPKSSLPPPGRKAPSRSDPVSTFGAR